MLKLILAMYLPMLLCAVSYVEDGGAGGGGGGDGGGAGGDGAGGDGAGGDGDGAGDGGTKDNGTTRSRELNPDGKRKETAGAGEKWFEKPGLLSDPKILTDKDKEYKTIDDLVKGFQSARQMAAAKGIPIPGKDATPEQKAAFKAEVMKNFPDLPMAPDSADQYEIPMFKDSGLAPERQKDITSAFHKAGLSKAHAAAVMDVYADQVAKDVKEAQTQIETQRKATDAELKQAWGAEFTDRMAGIDRVGGKYPELMAAMKSVGLDARKDFREMMDAVARSTAEDHPGGAGGSGADGVDAQIKAIRESPQYKKGNALERKAANDQLAKLYEQRSKGRKK